MMNCIAEFFSEGRVIILKKNITVVTLKEEVL